MNTLVVVAKHGSEEAVRLAQELPRRYPDRTILAEEHLAEKLGWPVESEETLASKAELLIVLGGDGTLIHGARLLRGRTVPILGVNLGSLGFMTEIPREDFFSTVDDVLAGHFRTESRLKLTCRLWRQGQVVVEDEILNDVVINKGALARIADHEMCIDGQYVTTYKSDGVIVATPTGSTAYSLSAGGPIVSPAVDCIIATPISPHTLAVRPLVLGAAETVTVEVLSPSEELILTIDGQEGAILTPGDRLVVSRAPTPLCLVRFPGQTFFSTLRRKLRWGDLEERER